MAVRPVVITGDPVLHRPAAKVARFDEDLRALVADMYETMDAAHGVGLAAPQIGVGLRIFTYTFQNDDDVAPRGVLVNPVLTPGKISQEAPDPDEESEGCLSVPGYSWPLKRADWVRVAGFDVEGRPVDSSWLAMAADWFPPPAFVRLEPPTGGVSIDLTTHIHRPHVALDEDEWLIMKQHPSWGYEMLAEVSGFNVPDRLPGAIWP